jgi:hypothetical protein
MRQLTRRKSSTHMQCVLFGALQLERVLNGFRSVVFRLVTAVADQRLETNQTELLPLAMKKKVSA